MEIIECGSKHVYNVPYGMLQVRHASDVNTKGRKSRVRFPVCLLPRNQMSAENMKIRKTFFHKGKVLQNQPYGNPFSEKLKAILVYILPEMDLKKDLYEKTFY